MFLGYRPQDKWIINPPDNSQLQVDSTIEQVNRFRQFAQNFHMHLQQFEQFIIYLRNPYQRNRQFSIVTEKTQFFIAISELEKGEHILIETFNQKTISYKGYISWFLIANENVCYLIDSATLHDEIRYLQHILENPKMIKFALNTSEVVNNFKRDFRIGILNVFNIQFVGTLCHPRLKQVKEELNNDIQNQIQNNYKLLSQRPITKQLQHLVKRYLDMLIDHLYYLPVKPPQQNLTQEAYLYHLKCFYNRDNLQQNISPSCYLHRPQTHQYNPQNFSQKQLNLIDLLVDLREHMAKMRDVSPLIILPNSILNQIVTANANSVLQIAQIYQQKNLKIGMQFYNRIHNTIQLNQQKIKDLQGLQHDFLQKFIPNTPARQKDTKDVKKLLRDIEWGQSSEWLNRKNDPSIKLYKQIISIEEFDQSIYDQFLDSMKQQGLKKSQIDKFLKYAQFMRGRNKGRLQEYYKANQIRQQKQNQLLKKIKKSYGSDSQFSNPSDYSSDYMMEQVQEHQDQDNQQSNKFSKKGPFKQLSLEDDDDSDESPQKGACNKRLFFDNLDPEKSDEEQELKEKIQEKPKFQFRFKEMKSVTSLEDKIEEKEYSLPSSNKKPISFTFPNRKSETKIYQSASDNSRKGSDQYDSSQICFEEQDRSTIKALPESIQQIYSLAIEAKKKINKKNNKKKVSKEQREQKKEIDFVPRQTDMRYALAQKNNNLK